MGHGRTDEPLTLVGERRVWWWPWLTFGEYWTCRTDNCIVFTGVCALLSAFIQFASALLSFSTPWHPLKGGSHILVGGPSMYLCFNCLLQLIKISPPGSSKSCIISFYLRNALNTWLLAFVTALFALQFNLTWKKQQTQADSMILGFIQFNSIVFL